MISHVYHGQEPAKLTLTREGQETRDPIIASAGQFIAERRVAQAATEGIRETDVSTPFRLSRYFEDNRSPV